MRSEDGRGPIGPTLPTPAHRTAPVPPADPVMTSSMMGRQPRLMLVVMVVVMMVVLGLPAGPGPAAGPLLVHAAHAAGPAAALPAAAASGECVAGLVDALTLQINGVMARAGVIIPDVRAYVAAPLAAFNSCVTLTANGGSPEPKTVQWLLSPGWQGGAIFDIMRIASIVLNLQRYNFLQPDMLPPPSALNTPEDFTQQLRKPKVNYTLVSQDLSGMSMTDFLTNPDVHLDRLSSLPVFHDLPENFCVEPLSPRGPLHPRTFLLTVYRADVLAALAAEGLVPDPLAALSEWVDLLSLLDTYAGLVRRQRQDPTSLPARLPALPPYPICINTDSLCGRQTDVLSAIAASVIQTRGTEQGYFLDLSPRPPAVVPLFNTTGWRYAAGVLAALLQHNPSPKAAAAVAAAMGVPDGEGGPSCHGMSQMFTSGQCLLSLDFDSVLVLGTGVPPISQPGQIGVAPLPGSRLVVPPPGGGGYAAAADGSASAAAAGSATNSSTGGSSGSGSGSGAEKYGLDASGLVACTEALCATSHNHDLLYLQPSLAGAEAAAAASDSVTGPDRAARNRTSLGSERTSMGDNLLLALAKREAEAAERLRAAAPGAVVVPPLVNRAPYSVVLDWVFNVRYKGAGVDTASLGDMVAMQQWSVQGLDGFRARRQAATDGLRQRLGFDTAIGASQEHACNGYATEDWWRLLAPSQHLNASSNSGTTTTTTTSSSSATSTSISARRLLNDAAAAPPAPPMSQAHPRNLSFMYADWAADGAPLAAAAGSGDAAGFGGHLYRALWHATHSPNLAADMRSPVVINFFRYAIDHGSMLLLPPAASSNNSGGSSSNASSSSSAQTTMAAAAQVDAALALMDRVWGLATAALGGAVVRSAYEASISAPAWQAPPGDSSSSGSNNVPTIIVSTVVAVCVASVLLVAAVLAAVHTLQRQRLKRNRDVWGRVLAPRAGPDTTLLVTDVQNSTVLWEGLPVAVMDIVLKLHHGIIRSVLSEHDGYESCTEGDSLICAFTSPSAALDFATSCQVALLKADWPPALLDHPDGAPLLVLSPHDPRDAERSTAALAALGLLPSRQMSSRRLMPSVSGFGSKVGQGSGRASRKSLTGGGSPASSRGGTRVSAAGIGPGGPFANTARRLSAPGAVVHGRLAAAATSLPNSTHAALAGRGDTGVLPSAPPSGVRSAEVPFSFTATSLGAASSAVGGVELGLRGLLGGGGGGGGMLSGPQDHLAIAVMGGALVEPAGAAALGAGMRAVSATGIMTKFVAGSGPVHGAAAATDEGGARSGDGGGGGGGGGIALLGGPAGCGGPCCRWSDMMAAAFPVLSLDTREGRRLAMLLGAGGGGGGSEGGRRSKGGAEGGWGSHGDAAGEEEHPLRRVGGGSGSGSNRDVGAEEAEEEEVEREAEDEGCRGPGPSAVRRATTGLMDVMMGGSGQLVQLDGWEPGAAAPCVHLPDGRLALVVYRGLRVRMGLHTGLDDPEAVAFNKVASAYAYKGPFAEMAKLVSDAAHGGLITLSSQAFVRLRNTRADKGAAGAGNAATAHHKVHHHHNHHEDAAAVYEGDEEEGGAHDSSSGSGGAAAIAGFLQGVRRVLGMRRAQAAAAASAAAAARGAIVVFAGRHRLSEPAAPKAPPPVRGASARARGLRADGAHGRGSASTREAGTEGVSVSAPAGPVAEATLSREPSVGRLQAQSPATAAVVAAEAAAAAEPVGRHSLAGTSAACGASGSSAAGAQLMGVSGAGGQRGGMEPAGTNRAAFALAAPLSAEPVSPTSIQPAREIRGAVADAATAEAAGLAPPPPPHLARLPSTRQQPILLQQRLTFTAQPHRLHQSASGTTHPHPHSQPQPLPQPSNLAAMLADALAEAASATDSAMGSPVPRCLAANLADDADDVAHGAPSNSGNSGNNATIPARLRMRQRAGGSSGGGCRPQQQQQQLGRRRHSAALLAHMMPETAEPLFLAAHPSLVCRLALAPPLRVVKQCALGSLAAPVRVVTVAFMKVAGASVLLSDLPGPAARALDAFQRVSLGLLAAAGGYAVEAGDGLVLAAFGSSVAAVGWAADCVAALRRYPWEEALLAHELCAEELAPGSAAAAVMSNPTTPTATFKDGWVLPAAGAGEGAGGAAGGGGSFTLRRQQSVLIQTGPRIKCGLDVGEVTHTLTEASGRLSYRGRPMNRAARIAGICAAGQVLVSGDTWAAAAAEDERLLERYCGVSLGRMALKGLAAPIEVVEVVPEQE